MKNTLWISLVIKDVLLPIKSQHSFTLISGTRMDWATSWENLLLPYVNNNGADQPAHPRSLISVFVVRCLDSMAPIVVISKSSRLQLVSAAEQAGLSLTWSDTPKTGFYFSARNKSLTAKLLQQGYRYHKLWKTNFIADTMNWFLNSMLD